jgi:hypothetical protein
MQALRIGSNPGKAKQNLIEQVRPAFGKGNAQQDGQVMGLGSKSKSLR